MTQTAASLETSAQIEICEALNQAVAETAVTTMLAQNFHWNVTGMAFGPLHAMFQTIYEDHFVAQDDLAERVKALKGHADGTLAGMIARSKVQEVPNSADMSALEMLSAMIEAQEVLASTLAGASDIAAAHGDKLTEDLCVGRGRVHEKNAWLLSAHKD